MQRAVHRILVFAAKKPQIFLKVVKKLLLFLLVRIRNHGFLFEGKEK